MCEDILLPSCCKQFINERVVIKRVSKKSSSWLALQAQIIPSSPIIGKVRIVEGTMYVDNIILPRKFSSYTNCEVSITALQPKYNKETSSYSWIASNVLVLEGTIEYDSTNNLYYCKNVIIPGTSLEEGSHVRINKVVKNMKEGTPYYYFCTDYSIENQ